MRSAHTTVLLVVPGRRTISLELKPHWPAAAMVGTLLVPLLMGAAAHRCMDALHGSGQQACAVAASEVTGSLHAASSTPVVHRIPLASSASRGARDSAPRAAVSQVRVERAKRFTEMPMLTAIAQPAPRSTLRVASPFVVPDTEELSTSWLRVQALHLGESIRVRPFDAEGVADPQAFEALRHLMRCRITGTEIEIDPRLVRILAAIGATYNKPIQLVSGHRQAHVIGTSSTSQHTLGKAADIRIAGVAVDELRDLAVKLGARGAGVYPEKGFVHIDVRDKKYLWTYTQADGEQHYIP